MTMKQPKLDKKIKANWIKALLSGDYKQGSAALRNGNKKGGFCCLGVLADINGILLNRKQGEYDDNWTCIKVGGNRTDLPNNLSFGLTRQTQAVLAEMNDGWDKGEKIKPKTFKQIAAWIRKNL